MEETKKLAIPDGYEFDRVENGEVILKKKETVLPKAWNEIRPLLGEMDCLTVSVPDGMGDATRILCDLICARNAWWKQLEWEPNWNDEKEPFKWCIHSIKGGNRDYITFQVRQDIGFPDTRDSIRVLVGIQGFNRGGEGVVMKKGMPATSPRGASNNYLLLTKNEKYLDRLGYIRFPFLTM